ncbi:MAG: CarD family transcriptional regulator [Spirochaetaceae bacterium]
MAKSSRTKQKTTFQTDQEVVYPLQGVGKVISIEERDFRNEKLLYYIIYLEVSDMTVMVPVDKAEELGIRAIVNKKEADAALKLITEDYEPVTADWKMRYQMNHDLLKQGSVKDIATVVRALYHRSKVKELPILERKLFDSALKLLVDEVSFSLNKPKADVEKNIFEKLNVVHERQAAAASAKAASVPVDDDDDLDEEF